MRPDALDDRGHVIRFFTIPIPPGHFRMASALNLLATLFLSLSFSLAHAAELIAASERGLLDRADALQAQTIHLAEKALEKLEKDARLRAAILVLDGLPQEAGGKTDKAASAALAGWRPEGPAGERLVVLIDKSSRSTAIVTSEGLKAKFPAAALGALSDSVSDDALRVGDLDGAVAGVLKGLGELGGRASARSGGRTAAETPMKVDRVDGLVAVPALTRPVTDLTATLQHSETATLETRLLALKTETGAQIAVLLTPTTEPEAIEQYSMRVVEAWKLGQAKIDNGVLLLIARDDRKMRIEVGYGLEGALNDATARRIIGDVIAPRFKQNDYFGGIQAGIEAMARVVRAEPMPAAPIAPQDEFRIEDTLALWIATLGGLVLSFFLRTRMPLTRSAFYSALAGAGLGLVLGLFMGGPLLALLSAIPVFLGAHLSLPDASRRGIRFPSTGSPWPAPEPPSPSSWGGNSGGSDSSYSGGGGKFGGGGASGGW